VSFRVVEASPADAPELMHLHIAVLTEGRWFLTDPGEYPHDPFTLLETIKDVLGAGNCGWWVARDKSGILGFATVIGGHLRRTRRTARFEVMVAEHARSRGVGRALTETAIGWYRDCPNLDKLSLAVFDDNERAIGLYQSLGFGEEGRRAGEYVEADGTRRGDVLMALT
jgi:GNAT superfamily N-acetyltransferase